VESSSRCHFSAFFCIHAGRSTLRAFCRARESFRRFESVSLIPAAGWKNWFISFDQVAAFLAKGRTRPLSLLLAMRFWYGDIHWSCTVRFSRRRKSCSALSFNCCICATGVVSSSAFGTSALYTTNANRPTIANVDASMPTAEQMCGSARIQCSQRRQGCEWQETWSRTYRPASGHL